jgi:hypothetical protein
MTADELRKKAAMRLRESATSQITEATAVLRMLDEADESEETPTVRPPGQSQPMPAVRTTVEHVGRTEIVRFPEKGRQR